jgi:hypothetical protein
MKVEAFKREFSKATSDEARCVQHRGYEVVSSVRQACR